MVPFEEGRTAVPADRMYGLAGRAEPLLAVTSTTPEGEWRYSMGYHLGRFAL
jgi:hypothetical protein